MAGLAALRQVGMAFDRREGDSGRIHTARRERDDALSRSYEGAFVKRAHEFLEGRIINCEEDRSGLDYNGDAEGGLLRRLFMLRYVG